jgi:hypothetical protein
MTERLCIFSLAPCSWLLASCSCHPEPALPVGRLVSESVSKLIPKLASCFLLIVIPDPDPGSVSVFQH